MEHIAPLIQTVLWVGLIAGVVWRFNKPINDLLIALHKRIDAGSTIKAGPFELSDQLKPQDPGKQKEKIESELRELLQIETTAAPTPFSPDRRAATVQAHYFQAEDLVLRALQAEYGSTISRQVTAGADMGFDGVFVSKGRLHIVEVKYFVGSGAQLDRLRMSVDRIASSLKRYGWRNVQIILAVVFENPDDLVKRSERLKEIAAASTVPVEIRCYSMAELQQKFGVAGEGNG